jgi:iron complex outermembrane recepter protein
MAVAASTLVCGSAVAQDAAPKADDASTIVVTADRLRGSVDTTIPATLTMNEQDVASVGASNVGELVASLGPQTRSGGGRSGGAGFPVMLLNGRRVSSFAEMRDLPAEAVQRVEVFPEEVALKLGYSPDQRVVNIILKPGFAALTAEGTYAAPTKGGRQNAQAELGWFKATKEGRITLNADYERASPLSEAERGIVQPGFNDAAFRTLLPTSETLQLNGVYNRAWKSGTGLTLNLGYTLNHQTSQLGLPLSGGSDPIDRAERNATLHAGLTIDGNVGRWQWALTATADQIKSRTLTERSPVLNSRADLGRSRITTFGTLYSLTGSPLALPAGPVSLTLRAGFDRLSFKSETETSAGSRAATLDRGVGIGRVNIDIPLTSRRENFGQAIGDLSFNANFGYRRLTDFGGLVSYGSGLTWSPVKGLTATATYTAEDAAPTPQQLGDPTIVTPQATVFDFVRGETVAVRVTRGGNSLLAADQRRDVKLGLSFAPNDMLTLEANYFRTRSTNAVSTFPALSTVVEAAFPGRAVRDATGRLVALDQRPVNFVETRSDTLRWGLTFSKPFKQPAGGGMPGFGGRPGGPQAGGRPTGRGGGGRGMMGGIGGPVAGGRLYVALYHSFKLRDDALIAPGFARLDLRKGDALGFSGGSPRHSVELESGWFYNGIGFRVSGAWRSPTTVKTGTAPNLLFSGLATISLRAFINLDQRKSLIKAAPWLKGTRLAFRLNNITGAIQNVRDPSGATPFRYQSGYVDPLGRTFEISLRKVF